MPAVWVGSSIAKSCIKAPFQSYDVGRLDGAPLPHALFPHCFFFLFGGKFPNPFCITPHNNAHRYEENEYAESPHSIIEAIEKDDGTNDEEE